MSSNDEVLINNQTSTLNTEPNKKSKAQDDYLLPQPGQLVKMIKPDEDYENFKCKKMDLNSQILPYEPEEHVYKTTHIDGFGLRMLNDMGFSERGGIGRSLKNQMHDPIQFLPRAPGVGLGAIPKSVIDAKIRQGKLGDGKLKYDSRRQITIDEFENGKKTIVQEGKLVKIIDGKHKGMNAVIMKYNDEIEEVALKFVVNQKMVKVKKDYIEILENAICKNDDAQSDEANQETNLKKRLLDSKMVDKLDNLEKNDKENLKKKKHKKDTKSKDKTLKWVLPDIKLRIVNKKYKEGKYYLSTGTVGDIISPEIFSFIAAQGEILEDLREKDVETVIPKLQNKVMILSGKHKGSVSILIQRSKSKDEVVVQQLDGQLTQVKLSQYDISQLAL